ncbi:hypothetical protein PM082_004195 [Marasmius tenuissimus]|nr:hypothetical protein PM082_004195 [Marasmius tenuissimus]
MKLPGYENHSRYNFTDANVAFVVEDNIKFNIHRYFLERDSTCFSTMLAAQSTHSDGFYRVPELKIHEFESLLDFFYERMYQVSPTDTPIESWVNLLSISTIMDFPRAREHAIAAIDACHFHCQVTSSRSGALTPARMIQIANTYGVEKWLQPAYDALARRVEMVEEDEAEMIGMKGVLVVVKARETRLREEIRRARDSIVDDFGSEEKDNAEEGDEPIWEPGALGLKPEEATSSPVVRTGRASLSSEDVRPWEPAPPEDPKSDSGDHTMTVQSYTPLQASSHPKFDPPASVRGEEDRVEKTNQTRDRSSCPLLPLEGQDLLPQLRDLHGWEELEDKLWREIHCKVVLLSRRHAALIHRLAYNDFTDEIRNWTRSGSSRSDKKRRLGKIETQLGGLEDETLKTLIGDEDRYSSSGTTYSIFFLRMKRQGKTAFPGHPFLLFVTCYACKELKKLIQSKKKHYGMS